MVILVNLDINFSSLEESLNLLFFLFLQRNCRALGGHLASVHSPAENSFVKGVIHRATYGSPPTWIGGSDAQLVFNTQCKSHLVEHLCVFIHSVTCCCSVVQEGLWLWSDGSYFGFTNWSPGQPDNVGGSQHCLVLNFLGKSKFIYLQVKF